jgi:ankyrin repeat protein
MNKLKIFLCTSALLIGSASLAMNSVYLGVKLCDAAETRNLERVRRLLATGIFVDARDNCGWTPLMWAAWRGHTDMCELLIEHNARINAASRNDTPLVVAAGNGYNEVCLLLVNVMTKQIKQHQTIAIVLLGMKKFRKAACMRQIDRQVIQLIARQVFDAEAKKLFAKEKQNLFAQIDRIRHGELKQQILDYAHQQLKIELKTTQGTLNE